MKKTTFILAAIVGLFCSDSFSQTNNAKVSKGVILELGTSTTEQTLLISELESGTSQRVVMEKEGDFFGKVVMEKEGDFFGKVVMEKEGDFFDKVVMEKDRDIYLIPGEMVSLMDTGNGKIIVIANNGSIIGMYNRAIHSNGPGK